MSSPPPIPGFPSFVWPSPPHWLLGEAQQRMVLMLNHILQQEPEAMQRLARQKGQIARIECAPVAIQLIATPVGLLDLAPPQAKPDLSLKVLDSHPFVLAPILLRGDKPRMEIAGDVMLAAEVNWLVDHVRWDVEEDLSRILGDVPAHTLMRVLHGAGDALRKFAVSAPSAKPAEQGGA